MALGAGSISGTSDSSSKKKLRGEKNGEANSQSSAVRKLTESHLHQITVLRAMAGKLPNTEGIIAMNEDAPAGDNNSGSELHLQIEEISEVTSIDDEKEIQRILFILEGQKLVAPYPEGDFTSRIWHITLEGTKALNNIENALVEE